MIFSFLFLARMNFLIQINFLSELRKYCFFLLCDDS